MPAIRRTAGPACGTNAGEINTSLKPGEGADRKHDNRENEMCRPVELRGEDYRAEQLASREGFLNP